MTTIKRPLCHLWQNAKFIYKGHVYTVYQHEANMTEVFGEGRFWAWPHFTGIEQLQVNWINHV